MKLKLLSFPRSVAIGGAAIVYGITPPEAIGSLGVTAPGNGVTTFQAFAVELVLTFILVFVIFAATDPERGMTGYGVPLAIGICVFICLMHGVRTELPPVLSSETDAFKLQHIPAYYNYTLPLVSRALLSLRPTE